VLTICETNAELLRTVSSPVDHHKVHVVYNGIDTVAFAPRSFPTAEVAGAVVSVGRFVDKKGFEVLLDALATVVRSSPDVHLTIYGDGPMHPVLEDQIAALELAGHVTLAGECTQDELQQVLPSFAVFVLTPYISDDGDRDGLPTVLVEAMSCGLPVVTTDVAGISDLVQHGVNGLLCPPRQVAPVADALRALLADPSRRKRLGDAARQTVLARFDQATTARQVADLLIGSQP
jgi:glycosyltransferase involved in cell wall biosynthesis